VPGQPQPGADTHSTRSVPTIASAEAYDVSQVLRENSGKLTYKQF
jgi:hypothetical protein